MTTVETAQEMAAASVAAEAAAPVMTFRTRLSDLWPLMMVALGVVLTIVWTASLFGMLVVLLI
jgi:hypothetical protein